MAPPSLTLAVWAAAGLVSAKKTANQLNRYCFSTVSFTQCEKSPWSPEVYGHKYSTCPQYSEEDCPSYSVTVRAVFRAQSVELDPSRAFYLKACQAFETKKPGSTLKLDL